MSVKELTLATLKHTRFSESYAQFAAIYQKLFLDDLLSDDDRDQVLSIIVLFANQSDDILRRLAYRMALLYGNKTSDFTPLYDIAVNFGLIPVVALIRESKNLPLNMSDRTGDSLLSLMVDTYIENFRDENIVLTEQQYRLNGFFKDSLGDSATVVAPTSYGKSELIIQAIRSSTNRRICVLVPSKSLLAQTRKRILDARIEWVSRLVCHPEMHRENDNSSVYILTQERLTRLLNQHKDLFFDIVIVDEAHNLLSKDMRSILLASTVRFLEFRNPDTAFKFLTPFLKDKSSLRIRGAAAKTAEYKVTEYVKSEIIFVADYRGEGGATLTLYDHFTNEYVDLENGSKNPIAYLRNNSSKKNIVYFNKPKDIQSFARVLADAMPEVESQLLEEAALEIGGNLHEKYLLLHCMKHGVLYHHGSMNEAIRNYVEYLYRSSPEIQYLISNSTLLEGVNLPVERMFLLSTSKGRGNLRPAQFKNLIGRVNRFSEVFVRPARRGSLKKLLPEIHIVGTKEYSRAGANLRSFCEKVMRVTKKDEDEIENVLLEGATIGTENEEDYNRAMARLENLQPGITVDNDFPRVATQVGLKLLESNISEIDVFKVEHQIEVVLARFSDENPRVNDSNTLMGLIYDAFIAFIDPDAEKSSSLLRLESEKAQTFYAMFLDWNIQNASLPVMIHRFVRYWEGLPKNTPVFVGKWGDTTKDDDDYREQFTYMTGKSISEKINLAIVRIKEEEDFFDHVLFRFVEVLNELDLLDETFYKLAKYGTANVDAIAMINNGFSKGVAQMLLGSYRSFVTIKEDGSVAIKPSIHRRLAANKVGFLQRHEISLNVVDEIRPID